MSKNKWCDVGRSKFLHGSKWTEGIVNKFERYIHSEPEGCCQIADLALDSGVVELWEHDKDNHHSFLAWLLTTDNFKLTECLAHETGKHFSHKLNEIIHKANISDALKASMYIACCLRHYFSWDKNDESCAWWDKDMINHHVNSHGINYINLQGANLENVDLSNLKLPANLRKANLNGADLSKTDLRGAYLQGALVTEEQLSNAIVSHTTELP